MLIHVFICHTVCVRLPRVRKLRLVRETDPRIHSQQIRVVNAARDVPQGVWEVGSDPGAVQESFLLDRKMRRVERQGCSLAETQTCNLGAWETRGCKEGLELEGVLGNEHTAQLGGLLE